jgi:hypothetical protein
MNEKEFLQRLEKRAAEQEKIMKDIPFPSFFSSVGLWLGKHPWRILIPIAFAISLLCQLIWQDAFDATVLRILGGPQ